MKFITPATKAAYYAVRVGRKTGVFRSWDETKKQIDRFPKPDFKKFSSLGEATAYCNDTNIMYERVAGDTAAARGWGPKPLPNVFSTSNHTLWLFVDGSCKNNNNVASQLRPSGWGVVVVKCANLNELDLETVEVVDEICGPVEVVPAARRFLGATHGSNNTGELTAVGEALLWLERLYDPVSASFVNHAAETLPKRKFVGLPVLINCDSTYAANSVIGVNNGAKNRALIDTIRDVHVRVKDKVTRAVGRAVGSAAVGLQSGLLFAHVKGHSSHAWNDRADELAELGGAGVDSTLLGQSASVASVSTLASAEVVPDVPTVKLSEESQLLSPPVVGVGAGTTSDPVVL